MIMIEQKESESRIEYLSRVLTAFMQETDAGYETIGFDGAECDGMCLAQDIADEVSMLPEGVEYNTGRI